MFYMEIEFRIESQPNNVGWMGTVDECYFTWVQCFRFCNLHRWINESTRIKSPTYIYFSV